MRRIYEHVADCVILLFQFSFMFDMPDIVMYFASPERSFIYRTQEEKNGITLLQENYDKIINDFPECS